MYAASRPTSPSTVVLPAPGEDSSALARSVTKPAQCAEGVGEPRDRARRAGLSCRGESRSGYSYIASESTSSAPPLAPGRCYWVLITDGRWAAGVGSVQLSWQ